MTDWAGTMKPCPRCGGEPWCEVAPKYTDNDDGTQDFDLLEITVCSRCGARTEFFATRDQADAAWNDGKLVCFT